jgi:hypothetical protein
VKAIRRSIYNVYPYAGPTRALLLLMRPLRWGEEARSFKGKGEKDGRSTCTRTPEALSNAY